MLMEWANVEDYWPRRLLHIPTMLSYERVGNGRYNAADQPKYAILSYTWGRWEVKTRTSLSAIDIRGVTWKIPIIDDSHFSAAAFQHAINQMTQDDVEWAWIDVACIDQDNAPIKMDEVGRQASIFKKATRVYVWLSHLDHQQLTKQYLELENIAPCLWSWNVMSTGLIRESVQKLEGAIQYILGDPWFSSLWTLQEVMMRNDALILTQTGESITITPEQINWLQGDLPDIPVIDPIAGIGSPATSETSLASPWEPSPYPLFITMVVNHLVNIYGALFNVIESVESRDDDADIKRRLREACKRISDRIRGAGFTYAFSNNPNVQYGMSRLRQTTYPEDRIYAIMQMYNVRVGQAVRPTETPSLDALVPEFALAIAARSPILSQMFVHTESPPPGRSWCITERSFVPSRLSSYHEEQSLCRIYARATGQSVVVTGSACLYQTFWSTHRQATEERGKTADFCSQFDHDVARRIEPLVEPTTQWWRDGSRLDVSEDEDENWEEAKWRAEFDHLSKVTDAYGGEDLVIVLLGQARMETRIRQFGLILRPCRLNGVAHDTETTAGYERLGVLDWETTEHIDQRLFASEQTLELK